MRSSRQNVAFLVVAVCTCVSLDVPRSWGAKAHNLQVGVAKLDITPKDLTGLVGVVNRPFLGVHDPLFARALVFDNGVNTSAIVEVDLAELGDTMPLRQRITKELGIPADHMMIAATHDHSAPRSGPVTQGTSSVDGRPYGTPAFVKQVDNSIVESLRQAKASLQPARVGIGTGKVDVSVQRMIYTTTRGWQSNTDEDGFSDKTVWVIKFETPAGVPIAILMNYAVHSNVMAGVPDNKITGDLAGMAEAYVERQYDGKVVALFAMGAAADQYPKFNFRQGDKANPYEASEVLGNMLGGEVVQVANRIMQMTPVATIEATERVVPCDMFVPPPAPPRAAPAGGQQQAQQPRPAELPPSVPVKAGDKLDIHMGLIRINQIAITSVSGEVSSDILLHLKKESPFADTLMITLVNDRDGYIPSEAQWDRFNPAFVRGCAEKVIVDNLTDMMHLSLQ